MAITLHLYITVISTDPFHKFSIPIKSEQYDAETEEGLCCNLIFTYTAKYPEEPPVVELEDNVNIDEEHVSTLLEHLKEQVRCSSCTSGSVNGVCMYPQSRHVQRSDTLDRINFVMFKLVGLFRN